MYLVQLRAILFVSIAYLDRLLSTKGGSKDGVGSNPNGSTFLFLKFSFNIIESIDNITTKT